MADPDYSADLTTAKDEVRLLISDVGGQDGNSFIFKNTEIDGFLNLRGGSVFRAAATALRVIAANRVQVAQRISYLNLETHGDAEAAALKDLAKTMDDTADSGASSALEFASIVMSDFGGP